jgi:ribosomal protein S18 acetylase RimI-like enzyme
MAVVVRFGTQDLLPHFGTESSSGERLDMTLSFAAGAHPIHIRRLSASDSLEELTDLLHRAYAFLASLGLRYVATYQDVETTRRRIANGECYVVVSGDAIIGTITYYPPGVKKGTPWREQSDVATIGQLAVEPEYQHRGIGTRLMQHAEECARRDRAAELSLDTAEPAQHLIGWYTRVGYRFIEYVQWNVTNYRSVVMSKPITPMPPGYGTKAVAT